MFLQSCGILCSVVHRKSPVCCVLQSTIGKYKCLWGFKEKKKSLYHVFHVCYMHVPTLIHSCHVSLCHHFLFIIFFFFPSAGFPAVVWSQGVRAEDGLQVSDTSRGWQALAKLRAGERPELSLTPLLGPRWPWHMTSARRLKVSLFLVGYLVFFYVGLYEALMLGQCLPAVD